MDFGLTDAQCALQARTVEFAATALAIDGDDSTDPASSLRARWVRCGDEGVLGSAVPAEFGGRGRDVLTSVLVMEALGRGCPDNGLTLALNGQMWAVQEPILRFGTLAQKHRWLTDLVAGRAVGALAMTEPGAGSDTSMLATTARRREDGGYVLDGHKAYVGLAPVCDVALVFAMTDASLGRWGMTAFLVPCDLPGVVRGPVRDKMGLRSQPLGDLEFDGVVLGEEARLGPEGAGASVFAAAMEWERSFILASHVGAMQRQLVEAVDHARSRTQFGRPVGEFQSVANRLVDMRLRLETSRLLLYRTAWLLDAGESAAIESALTNLHVAESFVTSSLDAVRTHGARGYLTEFGVERDLRDAVGGVIYSGTSDIQRRTVAGLMGVW